MDDAFAVGTEARTGARLSGRYRLGPRLGGGGMAVVYRGVDERLGRTVAVKLLDPSRYGRRDGRARFEREARAAAAISHPNVVAVHDVGYDDDVAFIVMECLPGRTLADEIAVGPLESARVLAVLHDVLAGLAAAHDKQILHRDIKPGNILITEAGHAKLADFGIAASAEHDLTDTGVVLGTAAYLAPERVAGDPATVRSDVYAVGVVAYEALTGTPPFRADSPLALAHAIHAGDAPSLRDARAGLPVALCALVTESMSVRPESRPASAREFARRLEAATEQAPETVAADAVSTATATLPLTATRPGAPRPARARSEAAASPVRRRRRTRLAVLAIVPIVVGLAIGTAISAARDDPPRRESPPATVAPGPSLPAGLEDPFDRLEEAVQP